MKKRLAPQITSLCMCVTIFLAGVAPTFAGGALEVIDYTGFVPSPIPGHIVASVARRSWDVRCVPVKVTGTKASASITVPAKWYAPPPSSGSGSAAP